MIQIHGLQKMTLLDFPGKVAATIFLGGCDLRCPFCHNSQLIDGTAPAIMDDRELLDFLSSRKKLLEGVCLTGGEPLLRPNLATLIKSIKELGYAVKLDTNGTHPEKLQNLIDQNLLDYVAMDIKNSPDRYKETTGQPNLNLSSIEKSVSILNSGIIESEFRTTVIKEFHDENAFHAIGKLINGAKNYYLQPFVDRDTVPNHNLHAPTKQELQNYAKIMENYVKNVSIRGI